MIKPHKVLIEKVNFKERLLNLECLTPNPERVAIIKKNSIKLIWGLDKQSWNEHDIAVKVVPLNLTHKRLHFLPILMDH